MRLSCVLKCAAELKRPVRASFSVCLLDYDSSFAFVSVGRQRAVDQSVVAVKDARASVLDEHHLFLLARLEAHGGPGGDVETHAARRSALERESAVDFEEMKVAADLDGAVARVADHNGDHTPPRVGLNVAGFRIQKVFTRSHLVFHLTGSCTEINFVPSGNVASTCTS